MSRLCEWKNKLMNCCQYKPLLPKKVFIRNQEMEAFMINNKIYFVNNIVVRRCIFFRNTIIGSSKYIRVGKLKTILWYMSVISFFQTMILVNSTECWHRNTYNWLKKIASDSNFGRNTKCVYAKLIQNRQPKNAHHVNHHNLSLPYIWRPKFLGPPKRLPINRLGKSDERKDHLFKQQKNV